MQNTEDSSARYSRQALGSDIEEKSAGTRTDAAKIAVRNLVSPQQAEGSSSVQQDGSFGTATQDSSVEVSNSASNSGSNPQIQKRKRWTPEEDDKIRRLVAEQGEGNWRVLAEQFEGRTGRQVRLRYMNSLRDGFASAVERQFTSEEDELVRRGQELYGSKWSKIAAMVPGRSDNSVKNRANVLRRRDEKRTRHS
eukprot:Plantae.Rhodophyta-Rhodochaete_pulchella.ctg9894.p1 GENE.Plantae.Rhodophyta-Rhodochaete_pulchella.ctg9894~~Plantae.Rhodophyta-Rhodochaete_pulchella.ctg9894.p1  ORF type:complete len:195 (+),score=31.90 Plantae.Rhodophyta-Rhodochaete_pulchella.ctg9894:295-879(+)